MNILVTGGCGFIGQNLIKKLTELNHNITVFDAKKTELDSNSNINYIIGNFENIENYINIFDNIDIVYHLISTTTPNNDRHKIEFDIRTNLIPAIKLLNICTDKKVKKIIFASSGGSIYGNYGNKHKEKDLPKPYYAYAINKFAIENYLESFYKFENLDYTVLRITNPYGKNHINKKQGLINVLIEKLLKGETIEIYGNGTVERDYIYIDDVINALILSINSTKHKIFNISTGKSASINKILKIIQNLSGIKPDIKYLPEREFDIQKNVLDNSLAKKELNWKPEISLEKGIEILLKG